MRVRPEPVLERESNLRVFVYPYRPFANKHLVCLGQGTQQPGKSGRNLLTLELRGRLLQQPDEGVVVCTLLFHTSSLVMNCLCCLSSASFAGFMFQSWAFDHASRAPMACAQIQKQHTRNGKNRKGAYTQHPWMLVPIFPNSTVSGTRNVKCHPLDFSLRLPYPIQ